MSRASFVDFLKENQIGINIISFDSHSLTFISLQCDFDDTYFYNLNYLLLPPSQYHPSLNHLSLNNTHEWDVYSGGAGNFVCIKVPSHLKPDELVGVLEKENIYIRDISRRFPGYVRITIGLDMDRVGKALIRALAHWLSSTWMTLPSHWYLAFKLLLLLWVHFVHRIAAHPNATNHHTCISRQQLCTNFPELFHTHIPIISSRYHQRWNINRGLCSLLIVHSYCFFEQAMNEPALM